jgi:hypothetical protein
MSSGLQVWDRVRVRENGVHERRFWGRTGCVVNGVERPDGAALEVVWVMLDGEGCPRFFLGNEVERQ